MQRGRSFVSRGGTGAAPRGRGFADRGGRGAGRGRGNARVTFDDSDDDRAPANPVTTVIRDDGTEVPAKVNNKVFVDGLPYTEPKEGKSLFDQLTDFAAEWKVGKVVALAKKDGQGFGYLAFRSPNSVDVACRVLNGRKFLGRALRIELPKQREGFKHVTASETPHDRQVLLTDLSKICTPDVIREVIRDSAPALEERVEQIKLVSAGRKAFVTVSSSADVEPFVNFMHGFKLLGRRIAAEPARPPGALPFSRSIAPKAYTSDAVAGATGESTHADVSSCVARAVGASDAVVGSNAEKKFPMPVLGERAAGTAAVRFDERGSKEVIVANVPDEVTAADLKAHFAKCGTVKAVSVIVNPHTHEPSGLARISFALAGHARVAAASLNNSRLKGSTLRVDRDGEDASMNVTVGSEGVVASKTLAREAIEVNDDAMAEVARKFGVKHPKKFAEQHVKEQREQQAATAAQRREEREQQAATAAQDREEQREQPAATAVQRRVKAATVDFDNVVYEAPLASAASDSDDDVEHFADVATRSAPKPKARKARVSKPLKSRK